jgi:16S rRNA (cytosine967-C5)-methyltransferase
MRPPAAAARAALADEMCAAARALADMAGGERLPDALQRHASTLPIASRAPARDMAYQTVRRFGRLQALAAQLNRQPPRQPIQALQWVALAQLLEPMRAEAIVVDQAVLAAHRLATEPGRSSGPANFLNATLRRFLRERDALWRVTDSDPQALFDHPDWWLQRLRQDWPQHWESIVEVSNRQAPLTLRVNRRRTDLSDYARRLSEAGMPSRRLGPHALALEQALPVELIPGFAQGEVSVQDAGAQLAAELLDLVDGQRVLDACAAPGGKSSHILECADVELLAVDVDAARCTRITANLERCQLPQAHSRGSATVRVADAARPDTWWDGRPFDRILLDAPCSASGIVRRHPDARWLRRRGDLTTLAQQQSRILAALWPLLTPGGKLLFVTCSVFAQEGEAVIAAFLRQQADAHRQSLPWVWPDGTRETIGQLLPRSDPDRDHDGFFYALLTRRP